MRFVDVAAPLRADNGEFQGVLGAHLSWNWAQEVKQTRRRLFSANQQLQAQLEERRRAAQKISQQAALLDIASDAILVRDLTGRIQYWSRGAERIFGWSREEALGKDATTLLNKTVSNKLEEAIATVTEKGQWQGELSKIARSGKVVLTNSRWTLVCSNANEYICGTSDEPTAILTVDTDITEAKQLEMQFLRTQRLESLGTLASGIAHDLNNVLTPIAGAAYLLPITIQNLDSKSALLIENLDKSTRRAGEMVKQILSFARGVEGDRTLVQIQHILSDLKKSIISTLPKNIEITLNAESCLWPVMADTTQLHQVFMNLCVNARDAMPEGGRLTISARNMQIEEHHSQIHPAARVGPYVQVSITDTGTGMSVETVEKIFDPFFTTKEIGQGTGLGLSTSLGIIKSHEGFIQVCSQEQQGTTFHIYLPAQESAEAEETVEEDTPLGKRELILVVDDEKMIQEISRTVLEANNYRVITADDGIDAIAQYRKYGSDIKVVLTNMMMPNADGAQAIAAIAQMNSAAKIVVTSGLVIQNMPANVQSFLPKPYSVRALLMAIHDAIASERSPSKNKSQP